MKSAHLFHFGVSFIAAAGALAYESPTPSNDVSVERFAWRDAARDREVPAKIYFSPRADGPLPIVIYSHGLGGSKENYEYLGRHWAGCGYASVHLQHRGSDDEVWRNQKPSEVGKAMAAAVAKLENAAARPRDVSFAIDELTRVNADPASDWHARLDLDRIAVAGHSFGGFTAMAIAGQSFSAMAGDEFRDPRVKAAIQMSAPVPRRLEQRTRAFASIRIPVFHLTGTLDDSPLGDTKAAERRLAFDGMNAAETCLVIFDGGDHMIFSGRPTADAARQESDQRFQKLIVKSTTAFLDGYIRNESKAKAWLLNGGFAEVLGSAGTFESKVPTSAGPE